MRRLVISCNVSTIHTVSSEDIAVVVGYKYDVLVVPATTVSVGGIVRTVRYSYFTITALIFRDRAVQQ